MQRIELYGRRFGRLTVGSYAGKSRWNCICDCGNPCVVRRDHLEKGETTSCGCRVRERMAGLTRTHGMTKTPEYSAWKSMKNRCYRTANANYMDYGARGVVVCERWIDSFENFLSDMGLRPSDNHSLERKNVDGNYEPENCCWATMKEQNRNRRDNVHLTHNGITMVLSAWAERLSIPAGSLKNRIRRGWTVDRALSTPIRSYPRKK